MGIPIRKDSTRIITHTEFVALVDGNGNGRKKRQVPTRRIHCCCCCGNARMAMQRSTENSTANAGHAIELIHIMLVSDVIED